MGNVMTSELLVSTQSHQQRRYEHLRVTGVSSHMSQPTGAVVNPGGIPVPVGPVKEGVMPVQLSVTV